MAAFLPPSLLSPACALKRDRRVSALTRRPGDDRALVSPDLPGDLDDRAQLRPLLALRQNISFFSRGKAALRREAKLIERNVFRGFVDAALDLVAAFERAGFAGDEPEHDRLVLRHKAQRPKTAGALGIVFHEIAMHLDSIE